MKKTQDNIFSLLIRVIFVLFIASITTGKAVAQDNPFMAGFKGAYKTGSQIRTMIEIKNVAIALEQYKLDNGVYPKADSFQELKMVAGKYLTQAQALGYDKWRQWLLVNSNADGYLVSSKGDDSVGEHEFGGAVDTSGHSITMKNGVFVQYYSFVEETAREYEDEIKAIKDKGIQSENVEAVQK